MKGSRRLFDMAPRVNLQATAATFTNTAMTFADTNVSLRQSGMSR